MSGAESLMYQENEEKEDLLGFKTNIKVNENNSILLNTPREHSSCKYDWSDFCMNEDCKRKDAYTYLKAS